jgi:pilus assembly protein Flp/PilA
MSTRDKPQERGASAVEYGLLVSGIAAVVIAGVFAFGRSTDVIWGDNCSAVTGKIENGPTAEECAGD